MKMQNMLPYRTWICGITLLSVRTRAQGDDLFQTYCSNENTGSAYSAVTSIYNSNGACHDQCLSGYAFAIVQWQQCWCSNYIPAAQVSTSNCNQQCPGFSSDLCGNKNEGLFGYISLSKKPSGTAGGSSSTTSTSTSTPSSSEASTTSLVSTTIVQTVTQSQSLSVSVSYSYITPTSSSTSSSSSSSSITTSASSVTQQTSVHVVTLGGATVTQTVTSTPQIPGESSAEPRPMDEHKTGLSGGAIAGIVVGILAGVALLALAAFLLWRRKRRSDDSENAGHRRRGMTKIPGRNLSVLSAAGLNRQRTGLTDRDDDQYGATGNSSVRHSMLFGQGAEVSPVSPLGSSHDNDSRRHSKPMVYDQRLNPSALFANQEATGSRVSMQDTQDYSRPLGVANPDPRASFDSRISHH